MSHALKSDDGSAPSPSALAGAGVGYTDYILRAPGPSEFRFNVMKFAALGDRSIDPSSDSFLKPVKLNRKNPQAVRRLTEDDRERINARALAAAAKAQAEAEAAARVARGEPAELIEMDAVKAEEGAAGEDVKGKRVKEEFDASLVGAGLNGLVRQRNKNNLFKKATKRVFVTSEEARRLKREEYMPWVLEDDEGNERWVGSLEGGTGAAREGTSESQRKAQEADKAGTGTSGWRRSSGPSAEAGGGGSSYVALVVGDSGEEFQVVPVTRWYKFTKGPDYLTLDPDEAESHYERLQKSTETERWVMRRKIDPTGSGSSTPNLDKGKSKGPDQGSIRSRLLANSNRNARLNSAADKQKSGLKSVIKGSGGRNEDDELRGRKGRRDAGDEQGDDEFDYEEDFADDEEGIAKIDDFADEEETKELEERIKREMRGANNIEEVPEVDDDEEDDELTGTGKELRKLVKKRDKTGAYDSDNDDELNPYASDVDSDNDSASVGSTDLNAIPDTTNPPPRIQQLSSHEGRPRSQSSNSQKHSRHNSKSHAGSRSGSPGPGSTSGSALIAKRATSPARSRGSSPGPGGKRKRDEGDSDGSKRKRSGASTPEPSVGGDGNLITEQHVIELLKTKAAFETKEVLAHFRKQLKADARNRTAIGGLLKAVSDLTAEGLVLKAGL